MRIYKYIKFIICYFGGEKKTKKHFTFWAHRKYALTSKRAASLLMGTFARCPGAREAQTSMN